MDQTRNNTINSDAKKLRCAPVMAGVMHKESELVKLVVRNIHEGEDEVRREIVQAATKELRRTYGPRENGEHCGGAPSGVLVALRGSTVIGTAEYMLREDHIYVQGIAVHPKYREMGVCRALLCKAEEMAKKEKLIALALCAIEETGNVQIFERLGFNVKRRVTAPNHVSPEGYQVTQVDMERRIA